MSVTELEIAEYCDNRKTMDFRAAARKALGFGVGHLDLQQLELVSELIEAGGVEASVEQLDKEFNEPVIDHDPVNHPRHYTQYQGLEIIDLVEQMNFNLGNAVKYITRAGFKDATKTIEDLEKAVWYAKREIDRLKKTNSADPQ